MASRKTVAISGVWIRRIGDAVEVLVEMNREWRMLGSEHHESNFSHIWETAGIVGAGPDPITNIGFPQNVPPGRQ